MATPMIMHVAVASQVLPLVTALAVWGRRPPAPVRQLAVLCLVFLLSDVSMLVARVYGPNLWVTWLSQPLEVVLTLWLLSAIQEEPAWRRRYLVAIPLVVAGSTVLTLLVDPQVQFDRWIAPYLSLTALAATLHTSVSRTMHTRQVLHTQDWFWVCGGLSLFWLQYVAIDAFANAVLSTHLAWAVTAYMARAALLPVAFAMMAWGVWLGRAGPIRA